MRTRCGTCFPRLEAHERRRRRSKLSRRSHPQDSVPLARHRARRRERQLEPAQLFRHEISSGQGLSRHSRQSRPRRPNAARRDRAPGPRVDRCADRHRGDFPPLAIRRRDRRRGHRRRRQNHMDAAWRARRRGGGARARRGSRCRDEPLSQDRIWPARRRTRLERRQHRRHLQPRADAADAQARFANARRAPRATTDSRPRRSTPAPCRTLRPARGSRRSIKRRPMCSRTPSTPRRCSICTISAMSTRA